MDTEIAKEIGIDLANEVANRAVNEMAKDRSFAWELISSARKDSRRWFIVMLVVLGMWITTIFGFIWYLNQYEYTSTYEYSATGVNAIVDNDGNIIAQDIPDDQLVRIMEMLNNGNGESGNNEVAD